MEQLVCILPHLNDWVARAGPHPPLDNWHLASATCLSICAHIRAWSWPGLIGSTVLSRVLFCSASWLDFYLSFFHFSCVCVSFCLLFVCLVDCPDCPDFYFANILILMNLCNRSPSPLFFIIILLLFLCHQTVVCRLVVFVTLQSVCQHFSFLNDSWGL